MKSVDRELTGYERMSPVSDIVRTCEVDLLEEMLWGGLGDHAETLRWPVEKLIMEAAPAWGEVVVSRWRV